MKHFTFGLLCLVLPAIVASGGASAQVRAGSAAMDYKPSGSQPTAPNLDACARACAQQVATCATYTAGVKDVQARARQCAALAQPCVERCKQANDAVAAVSSPSKTAPQADDDAEPGESDSETAPAAVDAEAEYKKLETTWKEADDKRLRSADQRAVDLTRAMLDALCRSMRPSSCRSGTGEMALPRAPFAPRLASNRWEKRLPVPVGDEPERSANGTKKPKEKNDGKDVKLGEVEGQGKGSSDDASKCCRQLSVLHDLPGNITDMNDACRKMGGDQVKNIHASSGAYCRPQTGKVYKIDCYGHMTGDCYKW